MRFHPTLCVAVMLLGSAQLVSANMNSLFHKPSRDVRRGKVTQPQHFTRPTIGSTLSSLPSLRKSSSCGDGTRRARCLRNLYDGCFTKKTCRSSVSAPTNCVRRAKSYMSPSLPCFVSSNWLPVGANPLLRPRSTYDLLPTFFPSRLHAVVDSAKKERQRHLLWPHSVMENEESPPLYPEAHDEQNRMITKGIVKRPIAALPDRAREDFDGDEEDSVRRRPRWIDGDNPPLPGEERPLTFSNTVYMLTATDQYGTHKLLSACNQVVEDCLTRANRPHPYNCRQGICGTCVARCTSGTFFHTCTPLATESIFGSAFRNGHGLMLTCCAYMTSDCTVDLGYYYTLEQSTGSRKGPFQDPLLFDKEKLLKKKKIAAEKVQGR